MFGGTPNGFYEEYHKYLPKTEPTEQYDLRNELYQLFHYLNHTLLFGVSHKLSQQLNRDVDSNAYNTGILSIVGDVKSSISVVCEIVTLRQTYLEIMNYVYWYVLLLG